MMKFQHGFSVVTTTETNDKFIRVNSVTLKYLDCSVATIVYYHNGEPNIQKNEMCVIFHYTDLYYCDAVDWNTAIFDFFNEYVGCVTNSADSTTYCENLLWLMYNRCMLIREESLYELGQDFNTYYPRVYYAYQYVKIFKETTRKIRLIIQ